MNELRDLLDRGAGQFEPLPGGWDRLLRRASRRRARRRVTAGLVALVVAGGGVGVAIWAFEGTSRGPQPRPAATVKNGKIAFVVDREGGNDIYLMQADGSDPLELVKGRSPSWSPDGTQMAFRTGNPEKGGGLETRINLINADGTNLRTYVPEVLGEASGEAGPPVFSPDGTQVAFDTLGGIYVMNVDGTDLRRVTRYQGEFACYDLQPSWSPDGSRLAFVVLCDGGNEGIWVVNVDGTSRRQVLSGDETSAYYSPVWSRDGEKIAFEGEDWEGSTAETFRYLESGIYVMDADGSNVRPLLVGNPETESYGGPAWSPDGSQIAFVGWSDEGSKIGVVNADGTHVQLLTDGSERVCCPAWQPVIVSEESPSPTPTPSQSDAQPVEAAIATTSTVGADGAVRSVVYGEGAVWVAVTGESAGPGTVLRIDPETDETVATIPVDAVPGWEVGGAGMTIGAGFVWVTGSVEDPGYPPIGTDAVLVRIDSASNEVSATIPLGGGTGGDVVVDERGVWVAVGDKDEGVLVRVDPATNEIVARIPVPYKAEPYQDLRGVLAVDGVILVAQLTFEDGESAITAVDATTNQVLGTWASSIGPLVAFDGEVWTDSGYQLVRIDPRTGQRLDDVVQLPDDLAAWLLVADDRGLWFLGYNGRTGEGPRALSLFDPETGKVRTFVDVPGIAPNAMAVGPGSVWVLDYHGTLRRIDLA